MTSTEVPTPEMLFGPDDSPTPRCSEWLAAYPLGLAHTTSSHHDAVDDLAATAAGGHHLLREARNTWPDSPTSTTTCWHGRASC